GSSVNLANAQTGIGQTTNVAYRNPDQDTISNPALIRIVTTVGSTPTCTYAVEGSADGVNFWSLLYADSATPATIVATTFSITSATTKLILVQATQPFTYLRLTLSSNTNVTNTIDAFLFRS